MAPAPQDAPLAPWPAEDKQPTILGSNITFQYITSVFAAAVAGDRRYYVDLLDELLEREPHGFAVLSQRILLVAGGRLQLAPARAAMGTAQEEQARLMASECQAQIDGIPNLAQALVGLLWALYYGLSGAEINWENVGGKWMVRALHWIHSRRIQFPDRQSWTPYILDGASAYTFQVGHQGIATDAYPGKFIIHTPSLRGDYPTRDGLGRQLAYWFAIKAMAARGAGQTVERFAKPWAWTEFKTGSGPEPRVATSADIVLADQVARSLGQGSASGAALPDSVKLNLKVAEGSRVINHAELIEIANKEISKATLGQTLTTEIDRTGSRAAASIHKEGALEIARYDAACLADTIQRDLIDWIVRLNWPNDFAIRPVASMHVVERPDPGMIADLAYKGTQMGMPLDADGLATILGLPLVDPDSPTARRLALVAPVPLPDIDKTVVSIQAPTGAETGKAGPADAANAPAAAGEIAGQSQVAPP